MSQASHDEPQLAQGEPAAAPIAAAAGADPVVDAHAPAPAAVVPVSAMPVQVMQSVTLALQAMVNDRAEIKAEQEKQRLLAEAERAKAQAEAAIAQLKEPADQEMARSLNAMCALKKAEERTTLARALIRAKLSMQQGDDAVEDVNKQMLKQIRKIASLSSEEQEDLADTLRMKRHKRAPAEAEQCARCFRPGHMANDCFAATYGKLAGMGHSTPIPGAPRKKQQASMQQQQYVEAPMGAGTVGLPQQFGGQQQQQQGGQQQQQQPQPQQQQQHNNQQQQWRARGPPAHELPCYNCWQMGHKAFQCNNAKKPYPGAPQVRAEEKQTIANVSASEQKTNRDADENVVMHDVAPVCAHDHVVSNPADREELSVASTYTEGAWEIADEEDETDYLIPPSQQHQSSVSASPSSEARVQNAAQATQHCASAVVYTTSLERISADMRPGSTLDLAPMLTSKVETEGSLRILTLVGEEIGAAQSMRAVVNGFGSKKKVLADEVSMGQTCDKCKKNGHTAFSCPDQTQATACDQGEADAWVRRLIDLPRVDIIAVNAGLSLEEGVATWLARGEELNRGNPWAGSTKMEDSLKKQLGYHKAMGMSSVHLGWIGFGVPLQFIEEKHPRRLAFRNHSSAREEAAFVDKEHESNLKDGSYVEVERQSLKGICPLQVAKHPVSGKLRLIQDLRYINAHLPNVKFRMESLHKELGDVVRPGDKMLTTDIAKAYYCLAMHPDAQPYLGWEWRGKCYMPTCLVFGLASAPRIFTKIMRPMMAFFRSLGVRVLGMIDDYLWAERPERIEALRAAVRTVFPLLGWSFNAKCEWNPADEVLMLGMLVNAAKFQVRAPDKKVVATIQNIRAVLRKQQGQPQRPVTIKDLQRVTGRLMSMMLALPGARVFTRSMYQIIAIALEGNESRKRAGLQLCWTVQLRQEAIEEMEFWLERLLTHNGLEINSRENQVQVLLWSDASDVGWGGEAAGAETRVAGTEVPSGPIARMASGALPRAEIARSSTRRELVALLKVASTPNILAQIRGKRIRVIMDSKPALANLLKGGGPVPELCEAVAEWVRFCEKEGIKPVYEWVERAANWRADEASKLQSQQHTWKHAVMESALRQQLNAIPATQWRSRSNHFVYGKVPLFLPMFHQIDARVEMIRSQLEEAIIVVPRWPAGGLHDWWRRISEHSIASISLGKVSAMYRDRPQTGHDDEMEAFWLMGRRGEANRAKAAQH